MAEALFRHYAAGRLDVVSAGLSPSQPNPLTIQVLTERGIDVSDLRSKGIDEFLGKVSVKYAVVVCDKAQAACPRLYPFATQLLYWPFEDPAAFDGSDEQRLEKFREVCKQIDERIGSWLTELAREGRTTAPHS